MRKISRVSMVFLFIALACLDPYAPPVTKDLHLLVVDGFLNSGNGLARVKLSRSVPLDVTTPYPAERSASVVVESESGTRFNLAETTPGTYERTNADLRIGTAYQLTIVTAGGDSFVSDFVTLKQSPVLKDVFWVREGDGISIRVDAEDPSGSTQFYQWNYAETWEYDADRMSNFVMKGGRPVDRTVEERIHICYSSRTSSKVLIATTKDQSSDVVNDFQLVHIEGGSRKLSRVYSILVQQRALDEQSYQFWYQLQKTTENLGGLFDPLPSQVFGNLHSIKSDGPTVLGYFSGGGVEEKRLYIPFNTLPQELKFVNRRLCATDTVRSLNSYRDGSPLTNGDPPMVALVFDADPSLPWDICMDCRYDGGTTTKPPFWPY